MIKMIARLRKQQNGMMLVSILIITAVLIIIGFSLASLTISQYSISNTKVYSANALMVSEAGIEKALQQINESEGFTGHNTEQVFFDNASQGRGVFTTTVVNDPGDTNAKIITATGKVYRYNRSEVVSTKIVKVTVVGTGSEGYSVHTGPGGLILGGSANITNSDVFVNGTIAMTGAARIGTHAQPLKVDVAYQSCPTGNNPGATYPTVCTTGQPISMPDWGSTAIFGDVCATRQTQSKFPESQWNNNPPQIRGGSSGQGLILGCIASPISPPTYNKAAHVAAVTTTGAGTNNTYVCNNSPFARNWPANLRLTGNTHIGSSCDVTINGNAYITGDLTIDGAAKLRVANSVGTNRPVILVDGKITVGGSAQMIANTSGAGIHFISMKTNASCNPNCTTLSGNNLKNSQSLETVNVAGGVNLPGMIFQAYWGKITLGGSGSIGSAVGQTVDMSGAGTVTFGTSLSSGDRTWTITSYQEAFPN